MTRYYSIDLAGLKTFQGTFPMFIPEPAPDMRFPRKCPGCAEDCFIGLAAVMENR